MPTIFTRPPVYSTWNPADLAGPYAALTLREWEVAVATCGLDEPQRHLLREALLEDATPVCERRQRWPLPRCIVPFEEPILRRATTDTLHQHLLDGLATLWQLLDLPPAVIPGMLRGLLLVGLGIRLRQTLAALAGRADALPAQRELEQALSALGINIEPEQTQPTHPQQPRRKPLWRRAA
jgi:hypothetical protein